MEHIPWTLSGGAMIASCSMGVAWIYAFWRVRFATWLPRLLVLSAITIAVAMATFIVSERSGPVILAAAALPTPLLFLALQLLFAKQPDNPIAVAVGDPILNFQATTHDGKAFHLSSMLGKPFLLKFYRGHW